MRTLTNLTHKHLAHWRWLLMSAALIGALTTATLWPTRPVAGRTMPSPMFAITVTAGPDVSAAVNDYRRIQNALNAAAPGDTIMLSGTFDFTKPFAAAAWALGNDGVASTADDYEVLVPPGLNNVTLTAASLGAATIQGPGDLAAVNLEAFLIFDASLSGASQNWTISNLQIRDFDLSIGMFATAVSDYNNTKIINNYIKIAQDLNATVAPADVNQNIGIHFSFGTNQLISGNTIEFDGDGVSDSANSNFSTQVGMQSNTSGGNVYDGLQITNNILRVLKAQSADPEVILGIWENAHGHTSNITVSGNQFINLAAGNNPALNLQRGFRVTSHSSATTTVKYQNNTVQGANIGFQWISGADFTGNQPVQLISNNILNNGTGVLIQSNGIATLTFNRIVGNTVGLSNTTSGAINAVNNWWGCNFGPGAGGAGCAGTANGVTNTGGGSVTFNPWLVLGITAVPNSLAVGGTSLLTADLTKTQTNVDTSGLGNIPNLTPVAFAGLNGTVSPSNTSTTSGKATSTFTATTPGTGSGSTTVDMQTVSTPIQVNSAPVVTIADPAVCLGPGGVVGVTVTVTNSASAPQTVSVVATLPAQLQSLQNSCAANVGAFTNCTGGLTVAWTGTLAAGQTATLTYQAQVANGTPAGTQLCIVTSATFGAAAPISVQACTTVNCPVVGPGTTPPAAAAVSDQKPGSVLFYNIYTSNPADLTRQNTRINITNTDPSRSVAVHLFFVDGASCTPADSYICLTPNQTQSFTTADVDPGTTGYIVAVASDSVTGCPINFNFLIGDEFVKFSSGHQANLGAEAFAALANTRTPACAAGANTATLNFDGVSYNEAPRVLAVDNFPSPADGNNTLLILNRVGGDLQSGASSIGTLFGVLYDEAEQPFSFTLASSNCQLQGSLSNNFLRIVQRLEAVVGPGRSGWLRLWGVNDIGLLGSVINLNATAGVNNFSQGHNLHKLTFTTSASLTIPIIPPAC